jgi:hypothetical protein
MPNQMNPWLRIMVDFMLVYQAFMGSDAYRKLE